MKTVQVRNLSIGEGMPKICVPIVEKTKEEIYIQANAIKETDADLVEWRADWFEEVQRPGAIQEVLRQLRGILGDLPLLFTFRTAIEGGEQEIEAERYVELNRAAVDSQMADLIDVEVSAGEERVLELIDYAHRNQVKVVASNHDFYKTPVKEELIQRLRKMQLYGADLPKIAVMPRNRQDVLTLLEATVEMQEQHADRPIITMSMSPMGAVSRICGEVFGSAVVFASAGRASAPGQIPVSVLKNMMENIHFYI